ncbi:hypothetical protein HJC23_013138 [Cyclotella cryptica]|uniref:PDZ domain-containing protein n=1 Tax=Cyclotella cryptica TaxID=29204 RepID=A0ABD3QML7_9STRA|eukprot:CCRYP_003957-RA/>CCRYP_003957-RA protein AED:0.17 eAED:0.17 QI:147/1/1/1/1/1/4/265/1565
MVDTVISPGDAVLTKYGTGVVLRCFGELSDTNDSASTTASTEWATIRLWRQPGKSIASGAVATLRIRDCVLRKIVAAPGMVVRASAGDSTLDETTEIDQKTINGNDDGDVDDRSSKKLFLIEQYLPSQDVFLASASIHDKDKENVNSQHHSLARSLAIMSSTTANTNENNPSVDSSCQGNDASNQLHPSKKYHYLHSNQIDASSSSAKFYPILDDLMSRGEKAWNQSFSTQDVEEALKKTLSDAVVVTSPVKSRQTDGGDTAQDGDASASIAKLISDTAKASLETLGSEARNNEIATTTVSEALSTISNKSALSEVVGELSLPQAQEIKQVYEMLRDENLTALFEKGRERLNQLVEKEIPIKTKQALGAIGIELEEEDGQAGVDGNSNGDKIRGSISKLRKDALSSLEQILKISVDTDNGEFVIQTNGGSSSSEATTIQINAQNILKSTSSAKELLSSPSILHAQKKFAEMYDTLSSVAMSDPQLMEIFSSISEQTKSWQEMTGRILQTKTASLFMEGSARLRSRAAQILNIAPGQIRGALGSGSASSDGDFTRAFTEGDVAMAKLKSMEMGDAIRTRLFNAIELRSESSGGLDAVIAGSLAAISRKGDSFASGAKLLMKNPGLDASLATSVDSASSMISEDAIQTVITNLQQSATSAMKGTKETLIALLSKKSGYRDAVLLRLEQVFMDMESQLGRGMSAEEIASIARGEGGTLALFQPVAMRAAKEIEAQLDAAEQKMKESKHWDPNADAIMGKVRQITRGELSMVDVLDMAAGYLDEEEVVAKSGGLIVRAETLLDEFEAASAKLGDRSASLSGSGGARGIIEVAAKAGITKEGLMKGVGQLDVNKLLDETQTAMTDETARRQLISSAGDTALDFLLRILPSMPVPPFDGVREGLVYHISNLSMAGFKVKKEDIYIEIAGIRAASQNDLTLQSRLVKASELLIIDVKNISATLDGAVWSFEQTYMPYLKGRGKANTKLWSGSIRLKFELRRRIVNEVTDSAPDHQKEIWEPVLCLNDRTCSIGGIELVFQGEGRITWVANKLTSWLKNPLRDYVVGVIVTALTNNSGWLIDTLNKNLSPYWDFVMRTANLKLNDLPILEQHHIIKAEIPQTDEVELVWRERVPLGLNILTNHDSGLLKVIDLPRGTQARQVAQRAQLDPEIFKGSTIVSVNGRRYGPDSQVELFAALKDPARPKSILFRLANKDDLKQIEKLVQKRDSKGIDTNVNNQASRNDTGVDLVTFITITDNTDIGIKFASSSDGFGLVVSEFLRASNDKFSGIEPSYFLSHVNGKCVLGENGSGKEEALRLLESEGAMRPLSLGFAKPYLHHIVIEKGPNLCGGPSELVFTELKPAADSNVKENKIILDGFSLAEGAAESGKVFIGDNLVFINGIPVGAGCKLTDGTNAQCPSLDVVIDMLKRHSPLALTFARANTEQRMSYLKSSSLSFNIEAANTFSIEATDYDHIGCTFAVGHNGTDIVVKSISGVQGLFQRQMMRAKYPLVGCALESVDDEIVPSYVNPQLMVSSISRRWMGNGRVKLTFCNLKQRNDLQKMCSRPVELSDS